MNSSASDSSQRRSSSRSIKRKRFDDEIVEYMLPSPNSNRLGRARTQSNTFPTGFNDFASNTTASATSPPSLVSTGSSPTSPATTTTSQIHSTGTTVVAPSTVATVSDGSSPVLSTLPPPPPYPTSSLQQSVTQTAPTTSQSHLPVPQTPIAQSRTVSGQQTYRQSNQSSPTSNPVVASSTVSRDLNATSVPQTPLVQTDKRLKNPNLKSSKKKKARSGHAVSTKDLGRWKPIDDLALIIGVQQTNDLKLVHRGTKFSCKFTIQEMQNRWYSLLYDESVSRIAVAAMRNLHPELVESVQMRALYTTQEEELLGTIKSTDNPKLNTFQELLLKNAATFYSARNAKSLQTHWQLMKQYMLLPDQVVKYPVKDQVLAFSDTEELLNDTELAEPRDEALDMELSLIDRRNKKEIRHLETELGRWNVLVDSLTGIGVSPEFDRQTLAVLRGRLVRYLMRSREITIGRSTKDSTVDVDLSLEGPAFKISRKQSTIKLRSNADFFMTNEGKRPIFVDGVTVLTGNKARLNHKCVIEIAGLRFIFLVNFELINAIQQESAKMNVPLT